MRLFLGDRSQKDKSYNGCGMGAERNWAFATYFLGQEDRGLVPTNEECGCRHRVDGQAERESRTCFSLCAGAIQLH